MKANNTISESDIPLVRAVPIIEVPTSSSRTVQEVEVKVPIPLHASSGFSFDNDPPRVSNVANDTHQRLLGYFFSRLVLPGLEISGVFDSNILRALLLEHQHVPRTLILTDTPPKRGDSILYQHDLPNQMLIGLTLTGFPPHVQSISEESSLSGRVRVGQAVHALCIPGRPPLMMQSGGFTASRVQQLMDETSHIHGRHLILKDRKEVLKPREGSRDAFDFGGCSIS